MRRGHVGGLQDMASIARLPRAKTDILTYAACPVFCNKVQTVWQVSRQQSERIAGVDEPGDPPNPGTKVEESE